MRLQAYIHSLVSRSPPSTCAAITLRETSYQVRGIRGVLYGITNILDHLPLNVWLEFKEYDVYERHGCLREAQQARIVA